VTLLPRGLSRHAIAVMAASGVFAVLGALRSPKLGLSLLVGGVIASANLLAFGLIVHGVFPKPSAERSEKEQERNSDPDKPGQPLWVLLYGVKMALLFGGSWLLMRAKLVDPVGLTGGFMALPLGLVLAELTAKKEPNA
jgi:ATP synthase I chain